MADNIEITAGSGTPIHTDEVGGAHFQKIKLIDATVDSTTPTGVAANPLQVSIANTGANATPVTIDSAQLPAALSGGRLDVVVGAALPAGTNAIGKLAANSGVDIGDVDVASIAAGDNNIGNVDIVTVPAPLSTTGGGTEATALRVTVANDSTGVLSIDDNGASITVDGSVTATLGAGAASIGVIGANSGVDIGDVTINNANGASAVNIQDGGNTITVDGSVTVTQSTAASLNCTEASASAIKTAVELIDDSIFADDAGFTVGTSKIAAIGKLAVAFGSDPDTADVNDAAIPISNRHRIPFSLGGHPNIISYGYNVASGATNAAILTISAGSKIVITQIQVTLGADVTTTPSVIIGLGTASTPAIGNAKVVLSHPALAGGGGVTRGDGSGILAAGADDEDLRVTAGTITGGSMHVVVSYFTIAS